jgi:CheY-like chemotaxis protein
MRVGIAEDQVLLREGLGRLFEDGGHEVTTSQGDAVGLTSLVADQQPDLVVLDVRMPPSFTDEGTRAAGRPRRLGAGPRRSWPDCWDGENRTAHSPSSPTVSARCSS